MCASKIFGSFDPNPSDHGTTGNKQVNFSKEGRVRISEEVIAEIASQALIKVIGVQPEEDPGNKRLSNGVDIMIEEEEVPSVVVDTFIKTKYGLRIPDIAWYVQESIRNSLEQNTGYNIKAVNVFVKGLYFEEVKKPLLDKPHKEEARAPEQTAKVDVPEIQPESEPVPEAGPGKTAPGPPSMRILPPKKRRPAFSGKWRKTKPESPFRGRFPKGRSRRGPALLFMR